MSTPACIVHVSAVAESDGHYPPPFDGEALSRGRDLGTAAGTKNLGAWQERLLPGRRTSFTHAHSHEEELVYVLAGRCHVRLMQPGREPEEHPLEAGHFVAFPAGTGVAHCFVNHGDADVTLLCVGERRPEDKVCYPDDRAFDEWHRAQRPERHWNPKDKKRNGV